MICTYEYRIVAACPVDDKPDYYDAKFEAQATIPVEDILKAVEVYKTEKVFQEEITARLARLLNCRVTTVGYHSGVKTTVVAP